MLAGSGGAAGAMHDSCTFSNLYNQFGPDRWDEQKPMTTWHLHSHSQKIVCLQGKYNSHILCKQMYFFMSYLLTHGLVFNCSS